MDKAEQEPEEKQAIPEGFILIRFDQLLAIVAMTIGLTWGLTSGDSYHKYTGFIVVPFVIFLAITTFVVRRRIRKFVRDHGDVEIITTIALDRNRTKKNVLNREIGELVDNGIDRLLDGKEGKKP